MRRGPVSRLGRLREGVQGLAECLEAVTNRPTMGMQLICHAVESLELCGGQFRHGNAVIQRWCEFSGEGQHLEVDQLALPQHSEQFAATHRQVDRDGGGRLRPACRTRVGGTWFSLLRTHGTRLPAPGPTRIG